jgi:hypothetical protein
MYCLAIHPDLQKPIFASPVKVVWLLRASTTHVTLVYALVPNQLHPNFASTSLFVQLGTSTSAYPPTILIMYNLRIVWNS